MSLNLKFPLTGFGNMIIGDQNRQNFIFRSEIGNINYLYITKITWGWFEGQIIWNHDFILQCIKPPHTSLDIIWATQWTRQYYSVPAMHMGSTAPDKKKESPKFTEVVTIWTTSSSPTKPCCTSKKEKNLPNRRWTKHNMHHKPWPWQH